MIKRRNSGSINGENNPHASLTNETVIFIRSSLLSGREIAKIVGVSEATISRARNGVLWKHLGGACSRKIVFNRPIKDRLFELSTPEPNSGCWLWSGRANRRGYGVLYVRGKNLFAHRVSYEEHRGPIPPGLLVCHKCDNPPCINPDHLFVGTQSDNLTDMHRKKRHHAHRPEYRALLSRKVREARARIKNNAIKT